MGTKIEIRIDDADKQKIKDKADQAGLTLSAYMRQASLSKKIKSRLDVEVEKDRLKQLNRIGVNLNQIARWANTHKGLADTKQVLEHLVYIEDLLQ